VEGRCKATSKREFKIPWREAGPPNHLNDKVNYRRVNIIGPEVNYGPISYQ